MLDATTKRKIDSARQILVGKVPDPKAQVEQITTALVYKFMDDMDKESQELGGKARFFTGGLKEFAWHKLLDKRHSGTERMDLYARAISSFRTAKELPQLFRDIFKDAFLPYRDPETLSLFLKEIDGFTYDHSENLGDSFEYLLSVLGSQGDAGQFRTPRHIIDFIVAIVDPKKNETILDPACGTAGFLISAYKHIKNANLFSKGGLTPDEKKKLMHNFNGHDISPDMVKLSRVNMYLHGFAEPKIYEYDTLSSEEKWDESFDVIMANPPFMSPSGGIRPHKRFSVQASRSEVLFVDYILEHLNLKGRAGIIVPEGIIFKTENAYKQLRKMLVEDGLFAVVSLPPGVFNPYSGVKTSVLFFDNGLAKKTDEILFLKIENDGFDLGAQRRKIEKNDLPETLEIIKKWKSSFVIASGPPAMLAAGERAGAKQSLALAVKKTKIAESGDYNLTGERYRETEARKHQKWPMVELGEVLTLEYGKPLKKDVRIVGAYPVFGSNGIIGYHNEYLVEGPFIIVGRKGTAGAVTYSEKNGFPIDTTFYVRLKDENKVNLKFLYFVMQTLKLGKINNQSGVPGLNRNDVYEVKIPVPSLEVQKEIVERIEVKQNAINAAREVIKNLERERRYFGEEIRELEGVEWVELGEIGKICMCKRIFKDQTTIKGDVPFYKIGTFGQKPDVYIGQKIYDEYTSKYPHPKKGDILISTSGTIGRTVVYDGNPAYFQDSNIVWIDNDEKLVTNKYLYYFFQSIRWTTTKGGTIERLYNKLIEKTKVPAPSFEIQTHLAAEAAKQEEIIAANRRLIEMMEGKIKEVLENI